LNFYHVEYLFYILAVLFVSPVVRDYLLNYARPFIFTTAMAHSNVVALNCVLDLMEKGRMSTISQHLFSLCRIFQETIQDRLAAVSPDVIYCPTKLEPTPIFPLVTPHAKQISEYLLKQGIDVAWVTPPAASSTRLRISLHANNTREEIEFLIGHMLDWVLGTRDRIGEKEFRSKL
jgi:8-amino-7-oxononanoate synthase